MEVIQIKNWKENYENNRTRGIKEMRWIPISNDLSSSGLAELKEHENWLEVFGVWILLLEAASKCQPRGTFMRRNGSPYNSKSLSSKIGVCEEKINYAIKVLSSEEVGWIEIISQSPGSLPAVFRQEKAIEQQDRTGNGKTGKDSACEISFKLANFSMLKKELHEKWKSYLLVYEATHKIPTVQAQELLLADLLRVPENKRTQSLDNAIKGQWKNIYPPKDGVEFNSNSKNRENVLTKLATSEELEEGF